MIMRSRQRGKTQTVLERFLSMTKINPETKCLEWTSFTYNGYGLFHLNGKARRAHRVYWEMMKGPIPKGLIVCHRCDNRSCVNPEHLFIGTHQDNLDDMRSKGRDRFAAGHTRGDVWHATRLSEQDVMKIRDDERPQKEIARDYGIDPSHVSKLKSKQRSKHI